MGFFNHEVSVICGDEEESPFVPRSAALAPGGRFSGAAAALFSREFGASGYLWHKLDLGPTLP